VIKKYYISVNKNIINDSIGGNMGFSRTAKECDSRRAIDPMWDGIAYSKPGGRRFIKRYTGKYRRRFNKKHLTDE